MPDTEQSRRVEELKIRGVCRTRNNPVADYTEWLVADKLGLQLVNNSSAGYDAIDSQALRYQIKCRRFTKQTFSGRLGAFRNLKDAPFDYLIGVIFNADFSIRLAAKIPHQVVLERASFQAHTNSYIFNLRPNIFDDERIEDVLGVLEDQSSNNAVKL